MTWWVNGRCTDRIPVDDRGLRYGDGVFETIAVRGGAPVRLRRHMARLTEGLERLGIEFTDDDALESESLHACEGHDRAVLKLIVTRGSGGRGYRPPGRPRATRIVGIEDWPDRDDELVAKGVRVRICDTRLSQQPALAGIKHLNRLEQVLARAEWDDAQGWHEGLMLDAAGNVIEATQSNLFVVEAGRLLTPSLTGCGITGIMRGVILEEAVPALALEAEVLPLTLERIQRCDEVFLCNSLIGIWPVREVDGHMLEAPGALTRRLSEWLTRHED